MENQTTIQQNQLIPSESIKLVQGLVEYASSIQSIQIQNNEQFQCANETFKKISKDITLVETERKKLKEPFIEKGKLVDDFFKSPKEALTNVKNKIGLAIFDWNKKLEEIRRKQQEELDRKAAEERRKAEEKAREEAQKAEEARRRAEEARREAEEAETAKERARLIAEAKRKEAQAENAEMRSQEKQMEAEVIVAPVIETFKPKIQGVTTRTTFVGEITNEEEFIRGAYESGRLEFITPNLSAFNAFARTMKREVQGRGYRIYKKENVAGCR